MDKATVHSGNLSQHWGCFPQGLKREEGRGKAGEKKRESGRWRERCTQRETNVQRDRHPAMNNGGAVRRRRGFQSPRPGITPRLLCGTCRPRLLLTAHWLPDPSPCPVGAWEKDLQPAREGGRERALLPFSPPLLSALPPYPWEPALLPQNFGHYRPFREAPVGTQGPPLARLPFGAQL